ncbi:hypothetical protein [Arthrobacter castelli]|uniref:hypothetical protein n=1 Tax=Arthrobacter castelli TaxID=271431 RepID=UPI00047A26D4|nr:hypothetical protein [Arthrobacter castelli]
MRRFASLALSTALAFTAVSGISVAAETATAPAAEAASCGTWQYKFTQKTGVYVGWPTGGYWRWRDTAWTGYYFNRINTSRYWMRGSPAYVYGNIYTDDREFVATGYVRKAFLDYLTCW